MPQRLLRRLPHPLLAGKVHYAAVPLAFVSEGECLPCCCKPVGAIRLDIKKR